MEWLGRDVMNKLEKFAENKYNRNKARSNEDLPLGDLVTLSMEQDALYKIIYRRRDAKIFGHKRN